MLFMKWTLVNIKHILNNTKVESKQLHFIIKNINKEHAHAINSYE